MPELASGGGQARRGGGPLRAARARPRPHGGRGAPRGVGLLPTPLAPAGPDNAPTGVPHGLESLPTLTPALSSQSLSGPAGRRRPAALPTAVGWDEDPRAGFLPHPFIGISAKRELVNIPNRGPSKPPRDRPQPSRPWRILCRCGKGWAYMTLVMLQKYCKSKRISQKSFPDTRLPSRIPLRSAQGPAMNDRCPAERAGCSPRDRAS